MLKLSATINGLRIISQKMPEIETTSVGIWVKTGARYETEKESGISHLLEHMAFKGTKTRSAFDISRQIENVGGMMNAYTSREVTAYYIKVLKEDTTLALDILTDIMQNSVFEEKELEREKGVVVQEIKQSMDVPEEVAFEMFQEVAFKNHPLGRPIAGTEKSVKALTRDAVINYMNRGYTAPRMIVSAAGYVEHDRLETMVKDQLAAPSPFDEATREPAKYVGGSDLKKSKAEQVNLLLGFEGVPYNDPNYYNAAILATILGGGMSSRLFQEIREKRGLVYSIYAFSSSYTDSGVFGVYAGTGENEVKELMPVLADELMKAAENIAPEELARAKAVIKASLLMSREDTSTVAEQNARYLALYGRIRELEEIIKEIEAVDEAAVKKTAAEIFKTVPSYAALGPIGKIMSYDELKGRIKY